MEFLLIMATMVTLMFGAIQVGLLYYAHSIVGGAANRGAQAASAGTDAAGQQAAEQALATLGTLQRSPSVQVVDGVGGDITVSASTSVVSIVPFLPAMLVRASAVMHRDPQPNSG